MIDTLLTKSTEQANSELGSQLFFKDTAGTHDNTLATQTPLNQGLIRRNLLSQVSAQIDLEGGILSDIFSVDKYLLNGVELRLKFWPFKDNFCLMANDPSKQYKMKTTEVTLKVCNVNVTPGVVIGHTEALKNGNAKYTYPRSEIKIFAIGTGQYNVNLDDVFQGEMVKASHRNRYS